MSINTIILLALAAFFWGITPIIEKRALQGAAPLVGLTIRSLTVSIIMVIAVLATGRVKELFNTAPKTSGLFALSGITAGLLAMLFYFSALKLGATSKIVPISATYPLVTVVLSCLLLGEQVTLWRVVGTLLIITGIWLVQIPATTEL